MPVKRRLLREEITYSQAKEKESNVLHKLTYLPQQVRFYNYVYKRRGLIEALVAHHLGVRSPTRCHIADVDDWMHGSFNLCIPVTIENFKRVLIRFPLPYRVGDNFHPGNGDEKVRCEAGTYAWLQQECPTVPIPHLYGFALSTGQCFTALEHLPPFTHLLQYLRRQLLFLLDYPVPSYFVPHQTSLSSELGAYLLMDYIEETEGEMLSNTWIDQRADKTLRTNLFRGLSQVMLTLSKVPLPKIGSFIIDDGGFLRLANRPLTVEILELENECIPIDIPRDQTYCSVDSYINDLISCHDNRLRHQPNAVNTAPDCMSQMSALALMRTLSSQFFNHNLNHGPFIFRLTDLHASNILVDKDWNVTCLIDLEWAASLPLEFMQTPSWLTSQDVDEINEEAYNVLREDFMEIFEREELKLHADKSGLRYSSVMKNSWERGVFWYALALRSPTGLHALFYDRIQQHYSKTHAEDGHFYIITCLYWARDAPAFIKGKVEDKKAYDEKLREAFVEP